MCQINCLYLTILFLWFTIHLTQYNFFVQASGFLGDSCLPLETIRIYRMYQTVIQYIDIPAVVVLTSPEIKSQVLFVWGRHETESKWIWFQDKTVKKTNLKYYNTNRSTWVNALCYLPPQSNTQCAVCGIIMSVLLKSTYWDDDLSKHRITWQTSPLIKLSCPPVHSESVAVRFPHPSPWPVLSVQCKVRHAAGVQ